MRGTCKNGGNRGKSTVVIKQTQPSEAYEVIQYMKKVLSETDTLSMNPEEFSYTELEEEVAIERYLKAENKIMLSARLDDKLVGMLTYDGGSRYRTRHTGSVGVSVERDYWSRGIATALFKHFFEWAQTNGITKKINLGVREDNQRAIALYKSLGFEMEGKESMSQYTNGRYYASICMGKVI